MTESSALQSYQRLVDGVEEALLFGGLARHVNVFAFHWPGNHPQQRWSGATFAARIPVSRTAGEVLGQELLKLSPSAEVMLVGHSLGCSVVLHCLEWMRSARAAAVDAGAGASVSVALLMAAAVSVNDVSTGGNLEHPLAGCEQTVFHSLNDLTLRDLFPLGQALFDRPGDAVGRHGDPGLVRWTGGAYPTWLEHGDYWADVAMASYVAAAVAPATVREFQRRSLPRLGLPKRLLAGASRDWALRRFQR